jgi:hypothetical protein
MMAYPLGEYYMEFIRGREPAGFTRRGRGKENSAGEKFLHDLALLCVYS